jgi:hypothetical protein
MRKKIKKINESITESAISPLTYIVFIDAGSAVDGLRGYLKMIFPDQTPSAIKMMFRPLINSKSYDNVKDPLKGISSRFSNNPSLKALFNTLQKVKASSYSETDRDQHENDIEMVIKRISVFIKRKLTEDDVKVLETILSEINTVTESISKQIDNQVESLAIPEESPEEAPEEMEADSPKRKTEIKVNERLKNKLRKKIKEIIRTHLIKTH